MSVIELSWTAKNPHLELFSLPQRYFTSQYKRPPIDDFVELIIENLEKWIWANQDGKEAWRWGKQAWRRCRNGDWDHQGGIQHWDKQTNVIENPKYGILCLEHEPYCCQSKWCWPVGCKQKLGGLSLNHLRPEVEWRSYFDKDSAAGESTTLGPSCTCYCYNLLWLLAGIHSNFWVAL